MPKIKTGTALRWRDDRGFGFIKPDDGGDDIFVHRNSLGEGRDQRLEEGDRVEYEECFDDRKGKTNAENVVVLEGGGGSRGGGKGGGRRGRDDSRDRDRGRGRGRYESPPRGRRGRDDSRDRGRYRSRSR
mmetsp:Transcript_62396/g.120213  ORF Transcript_62396/g.120213 Transcript_62396/m.120213 type:complete len:130 (+) Transcript_62396:87-476(+)